MFRLWERRANDNEATASWRVHAASSEQARAEANAQKLPNAWGSQVRSYILHPYHVRTEGGRALGVLRNADALGAKSLAYRAWRAAG